MRDPRTTTPAAALSAGAGAIHLAAAVPHLQQDAALGVGFLVVGALQLVVAGALLARPRRSIVVAAAVIHLIAIASWGLSRTVGLPVGPGAVEPVGVADGLTFLLELAALASLAAATWRRALVRTAAAMALGGMLALAGMSAAIADLGVNGHSHADSNTRNGDAHEQASHDGAHDQASHDEASHDDPGREVGDTTTGAMPGSAPTRPPAPSSTPTPAASPSETSTHTHDDGEVHTEH